MKNFKNIFLLSMRLKAIVAALGLSVMAVSATADDTELFRFPPGSSATSAPNVLIMLDTSANWQTRYTAEKAALVSLQNYFLSSTQRSNVNVGLMAASKGDNGGYVRSSIRSMTNADNRGALFATISSMGNDASEKSNAPAPSIMYAEAFNYLRGGAILTGNAAASDFRDYPNNTTTKSSSTGKSPWAAYWSTVASSSLPDSSTYALSGSTATTYTAPASVYASCAKNYIIYLSNGSVSGTQETTTGCSYLNSAVDATSLSTTKKNLYKTQITTGAATAAQDNNCFNEWARFVNSYDFGTSTSSTGNQGVTTYTIDIAPATNTVGASWSKVLRSAAAVGGGEYIKITDISSSAELQVALTRIFNQIQSQTSVFASAALPVSVNQRSTNLNQVYIGLFNTDPQDLPSWPGNLKEYKLGYDTSNKSLYLADTSGTTVLDSAGQFKTGVTSYWSQDSSYWSFSPDADAGISDAPDGGAASRGGAAQLQRMTPGSTPSLKTASARTVYTYTGSSTGVTLSASSCAANCLFNTSNTGITTTNTGVSDKDALVNWVRGANNYATATEYGQYAFNSTGTSGGGTVISDTNIRPSVHGDVLHSRPAVINYNRSGTESSPDTNDVVVFYGSNDGTLRAVQGGQAASAGGHIAGSEKWAFVAPEHFSTINSLRAETKPSSIPGQASAFTSSLLVTNASNTLANFSSSDYAKVRNFQLVSGAGIPSGAYVLGKITCTVSGQTNCIQISANATAGATTNVTLTPNPRPNFWDGSITTYVNDANDDGKINPASGSGDKAYIFATMRRGGRMIYAFDVTNPESPVFMWKAGCPNQDNNTGCTTGWSEIGQTWSAASPVMLAGASRTGNTNGSSIAPAGLALVVGGGYDYAYNDEDPRSGSASKGRAVFVVDALNGSIIRKFVGSTSSSASDANTTSVTGMNYDVPSDISVLARDRTTNTAINGYRAYFGDTGGQLWRIDLSSATPDNWIINKLADLGATGRKFFFAPDVVYGGLDTRGDFDYVLLGSGDREHPFQGLTQDNYPNSVAVQDYFFMVKDYNIANNYSSTLTPSSAHLNKTITDLYGATADLIQVGTAAQAAIARTALDLAYGWKIALNGFDSTMATNNGEKTVGGATTIAGVVYFTTNRPTASSSSSCGVNLGEAKLYAVQIKDAGSVANYFSSTQGIAARYSVLPGGGFPPTPVPVSLVIDGRRIEGVISGTQAKTSSSQVGVRVRTYVRKLTDKKPS